MGSGPEPGDASDGRRRTTIRARYYGSLPPYRESRHAGNEDELNTEAKLPSRIGISLESDLLGAGYGLLHIFDISEQRSPMIEPVAARHVVSCTCDGVIVLMHMPLLRPLLKKEIE
jgi:hypothetical protein